jgi:hypothetical protein
VPDGNCSEGLGTLPYLLIDIAGTTCSRRLAEDCRIGRRLSQVGVESGSGTIRPVGIFAGRQPKPFRPCIETSAECRLCQNAEREVKIHW